MKYIVSIAIGGRVDVEVDANSFEDAKNKVGTAVCDIEPDNIEWIEWTPVNAEDENGVFVDY